MSARIFAKQYGQDRYAQMVVHHARGLLADYRQSILDEIADIEMEIVNLQQEHQRLAVEDFVLAWSEANQ